MTEAVPEPTVAGKETTRVGSKMAGVGKKQAAVHILVGGVGKKSTGPQAGPETSAVLVYILTSEHP